MKKILITLILMLFAAQALAADITITIPTEHVSRVLDAFAARYPIPDDDEDGNPDYTKAIWARMKVMDFIKGVVRIAETVNTPGDPTGVVE